MTLDEFAKAALKFHGDRMVADILRPSPLAEAIAASLPPMTRWGRLRNRWANRARRVKEACDVLRGRAEADYIGYWP